MTAFWIEPACWMAAILGVAAASWRRVDTRVCVLILAAQTALSVMAQAFVPFSEPTAVQGAFDHPRIVVLSIVDAATLALLATACLAYRRWWMLAVAFMVFADCAMHLVLSAWPWISHRTFVLYAFAQDVVLAISLALVFVGPRTRQLFAALDTGLLFLAGERVPARRDGRA